MRKTGEETTEKRDKNARSFTKERVNNVGARRRGKGKMLNGGQDDSWKAKVREIAGRGSGMG